MENLLGALLANAILVSVLALLVLIVDVSVRRPARRTGSGYFCSSSC